MTTLVKHGAVDEGVGEITAGARTSREPTRYDGEAGELRSRLTNLDLMSL